MKKMYLSAPLPFVGQKRMFAKEFMKVLEQYPDGTLFVDLVESDTNHNHEDIVESIEVYQCVAIKRL